MHVLLGFNQHRTAVKESKTFRNVNIYFGGKRDTKTTRGSSCSEITDLMFILGLSND